MQTTLEQRQALIAAMQADETARGFLDAQDAYSTREWLNSPAEPEVLAWRTSVPADEAEAAPDYTKYDSMLAGKRASWDRFVTRPRDWTQKSVRDWALDAWSTSGDANIRQVLLVGTEPATNVQAILSSGQGASAMVAGGPAPGPATTGPVTALVRGFVGRVDEEDATRIVNGT